MREEVLAAARDLHRLRLVEGTAGNVSARLADGTVCVTPSGLSYAAMTIDDLVVVDLDGRVVSGTRLPSSELALHLACYHAFPEVGGVVHSHPAEASAFAAARRPIPVAVDEFALYVGGEVAVTSYAPSGSDALGRQAVALLAGVVTGFLVGGAAGAPFDIDVGAGHAIFHLVIAPSVGLAALWLVRNGATELPSRFALWSAMALGLAQLAEGLAAIADGSGDSTAHEIPNVVKLAFLSAERSNAGAREG